MHLLKREVVKVEVERRRKRKRESKNEPYVESSFARGCEQNMFFE